MRIDHANAAEHQGGFVGLGGFYVRPLTYARGDDVQGHYHYIPHVGNLVSGQVVVHWRDEDGTSGTIEMLVPSKIHMPARRRHRLEILSDVVQWECWFAQREADALSEDIQQRWILEA